MPRYLLIPDSGFSGAFLFLDKKSSFPDDLSDFSLEYDGFLLGVCSNRAVVDICVLQYSLLDGLLQVCGGFIYES